MKKTKTMRFDLERWQRAVRQAQAQQRSTTAYYEYAVEQQLKRDERQQQPDGTGAVSSGERGEP